VRRDRRLELQTRVAAGLLTIIRLTANVAEPANRVARAGATIAPSPPTGRPAPAAPPMTSPPRGFPIDGGCTCRAVRYRMLSEPLFVHCCHCRWCQRETGSAFALNALIEAERVERVHGAPELVATPSLSGRGQKIARCPGCRVALWSHYAGAGDAVCFVRVGTLDDPDRLAPDIHIYTDSKQPWVRLPPGVPAVAQYYDAAQRWPAASLARWAALRARRAPA
jgi:hypothetical protein